jgi:hypothetical protein
LLAVAIALGACADPQPSTHAEGSAGATPMSEPATNGGFVIEHSAVIPIHSKAVGRDYEIRTNGVAT